MNQITHPCNLCYITVQQSFGTWSLVFGLSLFARKPLALYTKFPFDV